MPETIPETTTGATQEADAQAPRTAARRELVSKPDEVSHVVCCRDEKWEKAWCGFDLREANVNAAGDPCAMCMEVAKDLAARRGAALDEDLCPVDGTACPDWGTLFDRVVDQTT